MTSRRQRFAAASSLEPRGNARPSASAKADLKVRLYVHYVHVCVHSIAVDRLCRESDPSLMRRAAS